MKATANNSITAPPAELALHLRLKSAGMVLRRTGNDQYCLTWRHQLIISDLSLLQAALFVHRALDREVRS